MTTTIYKVNLGIDYANSNAPDELLEQCNEFFFYQIPEAKKCFNRWKKVINSGDRNYDCVTLTKETFTGSPRQMLAHGCQHGLGNKTEVIKHEIKGLRSVSNA
tara:strand:- start:275 stop:583 length:309 start_codon:yes stop_codon:yes gene_type:complete